MEARPVVDHTHPHSHCFYKCVSWSSVVAGGLVGVGLSFLLNLFSASIGLAAYSTNSEGVTAFAVGGFIGFLIGAIASMFVAGMVAGYLAKPYCSRHNIGALYGFLAWALTLILGIILSSHVANFVSYNSDVLHNRPVNVVHGNPQGPSVVNSDNNTTVNANAAANDLSKVAFASFVLFFIGAVSACFGGHAGMSCRREENDLDRPRVV